MVLVKAWCSGLSSRPLELLTGLCVLAAVASGGAVDSIASSSLAILFVACLFYIRSWPRYWCGLSSDERLILIGFGLYCLSAVLSYYNANDEKEYIKHLGRYVRFLLVIPVYLLLSRADLKLFKYLLAGALISGPIYLSIALISVSERPGLPAQGGYHHITFGDMAMLNAMFMTAVLAVMRSNNLLKIALIISIACLLYASALSQARGAWLALPFCLSVLLYVVVRHKKIKVRTVIIALIVLVTAAVISPVKDVISSRVQQAEDEIALFRSGEVIHSSIGDRLAMWHIAINVWGEHKVVGTGPGDFDEEVQAVQAQGLYEEIDVHSSVHNIYLQALATTGAIGFLVMCIVLIALPFRFFYRTDREASHVVSLSGMVAITAFAVFGLTESWILRSPVVAVFLLYFVVLATTASKKTVESS